MKSPAYLFDELKRSELPSAGGRKNGSNKLSAQDRPAHDWYRFVLSYPPHLVREYVRRFELGGESVVLDPFCGTGTTLVECKKTGFPSVGLEANPMAWFASRVKTRWEIDPQRLKRHALEVSKEAHGELARSGLRDEPFGSFAAASQGDLRTLPEECEKLILANSISPLPLHKALVLLSAIEANRDESAREHELLAFAKTVVNYASNLHFGPEVGVGERKEDAAVIGPWLAAVSEMSADLAQLKPSCRTQSRVIHCDSRRLPEELGAESVDAVITSPPYPNEKDYTRTTRLESVLLGFIRSKVELQGFKRTLVRSNTRSVYKGDEDDQYISGHPVIEQLAQEIEARRIALGKTSGFERMYARVTRLYFGGMARHLSELRRVLRPGAMLAYVVGDQASYLRVMIRTGQILAEIASALGYEIVGLDLFRTRMATATRQQLREEVLVMRWPAGKALRSRNRKGKTK